MLWLLLASMLEAHAGTVFVFDNPAAQILAVDTGAVSLTHVASAGVSPLDGDTSAPRWYFYSYLRNE